MLWLYCSGLPYHRQDMIDYMHTWIIRSGWLCLTNALFHCYLTPSYINQEEDRAVESKLSLLRHKWEVWPNIYMRWWLSSRHSTRHRTDLQQIVIVVPSFLLSVLWLQWFRQLLSRVCFLPLWVAICKCMQIMMWHSQLSHCWMMWQMAHGCFHYHSHL